MAERTFAPIDVVKWTEVLRGLYEKFPTKTALWYVVSCVHNMWDEAAEVRLKIEDDVAPSQWFHLRGAMNELSRFNSRLLFYYHHMTDEPADVERFVIQPVLYGRYDAEFPDPLFEPAWKRGADGVVVARPDVTQIAMIRNQFVTALEQFDELFSWWNAIPPTNRVGEMLIGAKRQAFEKAAPGENPTMREELSNDIDDVIENNKELFKQAGAVGLIAGAVVATVLLAAMVFRDKD